MLNSRDPVQGVSAEAELGQVGACKASTRRPRVLEALLTVLVVLWLACVMLGRVACPGWHDCVLGDSVILRPGSVARWPAAAKSR